MELKTFNAIVDKLIPVVARDEAEHWVKHVELASGYAGFTICNLKPLSDLLGCEPEMGAITERVGACVSRIDELAVESNKLYSGQHSIAELLGCKNDVWAIKQIITALQVGEEARDRRLYAAIAQALNWERTEFDTLDEMLAAIRERVKNHTEFVNSAYLDRALLGKLREKVLAADGAGDMVWTFAIQDVGQMLLDSCEEQAGDLVELDAAKLEALRYYANPDIYVNGDVPGHIYALDDAGGAARAALSAHGTTHTILHAGELYRDVTILLHTEQLVAWRTADGQEYSARAHRVTLDPDEDGIAAAILSRIAGVEIAPEHMAELRAQMAGGVTHG